MSIDCLRQMGALDCTPTGFLLLMLSLLSLVERCSENWRGEGGLFCFLIRRKANASAAAGDEVDLSVLYYY